MGFCQGSSTGREMFAGRCLSGMNGMAARDRRPESRISLSCRRRHSCSGSADRGGAEGLDAGSAAASMWMAMAGPTS